MYTSMASGQTGMLLGKGHEENQLLATLIDYRCINSGRGVRINITTSSKCSIFKVKKDELGRFMNLFSSRYLFIIQQVCITGLHVNSLPRLHTFTLKAEKAYSPKENNNIISKHVNTMVNGQRVEHTIQCAK